MPYNGETSRTMEPIHTTFVIISGIILFLFGIDNFSREIQSISGEKFRKFLSIATKNPLVGLMLGSSITAVIQSSTATSVIVVGLVNAGVLSFKNSLGVIFGANIGTTITAQLVAMKMTDFAPVLIFCGFLLGTIPNKFKFLGKSIFYFGLVFLSLDLISKTTISFKELTIVHDIFKDVHSPLLGLVIGAGITSILQSSSVTTGIAVILTDQGAIPLSAAVPIILGANIGTTITSAIASFNMDYPAKRVALAHALYNLGGVILFLPFLYTLEKYLNTLKYSPGQLLAFAHFFFNASTSIVFIILISPFEKLIKFLVGRGQDDTESFDLMSIVSISDSDISIDLFRPFFPRLLEYTSTFYTNVMLAIETQDKRLISKAKRQSSELEYLMKGFYSKAQSIGQKELSEAQAQELLKFIFQADYIRQLKDSLDDLISLNKQLSDFNQRLSVDSLLDLQKIYPLIVRKFDLVKTYLHQENGKQDEINTLDDEFRYAIMQAFNRFIHMAQKKDSKEGVVLADIFSLQQRIQNKLNLYLHFLKDGKNTFRSDLNNHVDNS